MKKFIIISSFLFLYISGYSQKLIVGAEYFFDADPGFGNGNPVTITTPDSILTITRSISVSALNQGQHSLNFRFRNNKGIWGLTSTRIFYVAQPVIAPAQIVSGEYYFDTDPGLGSGTAFSFTPGVNVTKNLNITTSGLTSGFHTLYARCADQTGKWSQITSTKFYLADSVKTFPVFYGEYYFDSDPGQGLANPVTISSPSTNVSLTPSISITGLTSGYHVLYFRFLDQNGHWSELASNGFTVATVHVNLPVISGEYFFDTDPGTGKGKAIAMGSSMDTTLNIAVSDSGLKADAFHTLYLRFSNLSGQWGLATSRLVYVYSGKEKYYTPVNKLEFAIDSVPKAGNMLVDSVGIALHGAHLPYQIDITPDSLNIGRHYTYVQGIDFFKQVTKVNLDEFVVTKDTTKGMILGTTLAPDSSLLTAGSIDIYQDVNNVLTFYANAPLDSTGNFLTDGYLDGSYLLLLKPDVKKFPLAINTYYDLAPQWEMGAILNINKDTMFNDVVIKALKTEVLQGVSQLCGFITQSTKKSGGIIMTPNAIEGRPMKGASVVLIGKATKGGTSHGEVLAQSITDSMGSYCFTNVPQGSFDLIVDILGVPLVNYYTVDVKSTTTEVDNLNYTVGVSGIYMTGISLSKLSKVMVYPNPSDGEINVLFGENAGKIDMKVFDLGGRMVYARSFTANPNSVYPFDLHSLSKGFYSLVLQSGSEREVQKIVIH